MSNTKLCQSQGWVSCQICGFQSISERGLKQHYTKKHTSAKCTNTAASQPHPIDAVNGSLLDSREVGEDDEGSEANYLLQILMKAKQAFKILRIVPKGARASVGEELSTLLRNVTSKNDFASWSRLLLFPVCVLRLTHQKRSKHVSLATMVKQNLNHFQQNDVASLKVFLLSQCNIHKKGSMEF